jgi:hypothetical protein
MPKKNRLNIEEASDEVKEYFDARKQQKAATEADRDADFYAVVIFQSKEQRDAFFRAKKLNLDWSNYVDGCKLAERDGVQLPAAPRIPKLKPSAEAMMSEDLGE